MPIILDARSYLALSLAEITTLFLATTFTSTKRPGWRPTWRRMLSGMAILPSLSTLANILVPITRDTSLFSYGLAVALPTS